MPEKTVPASPPCAAERPTPEALWAQLRIDELTERSFGTPSEIPPQLMVGLAALRRRSALAAALAAQQLSSEALERGWALVARGVVLRGYALAGAAPQVLELGSLFSGMTREALGSAAAEALESSGFTAPARSFEQALRKGDAHQATKQLERTLADAPEQLAPLAWLESLPAVVGLLIAQDELTPARALCERFVAGFPDSDAAPLWRIQHALIALRAGDALPLRALATHPDPRAAWSASFAKAMLQRLEQTDQTGQTGTTAFVRAQRPIVVEPATVSGLEGRAVLRRLLGDPHIEAAPRSLGGLRAFLQSREVESARLRVTAENVAGLLERDAYVVLAEERPVGTGFVRLVGYEAGSGLLLVERFEQVGASLRRFEDQGRRCELHNLGALVVLPREAGSRDDLHDARFDALDACEPELRHAHVGRARAAHLTAEAVSACPDVPRAHQLQGEALLEQLRARELEGSRADGPIETWYAAARTRFEQAEWAHQIYAGALEDWGLAAEAAIAWGDASALDEHDYRNLLGLSRARLKRGYAESALQLAERAAARAPEDLGTWQQLAAAALEAGSLPHAQRAAELVLACDATDLSALRTLGVSREREGQLLEAALLYERALEHHEDDAAALRAALARLRCGDAQAAQAHAETALGYAPSGSGYRVLALATAASGQALDALDALELGLSRIGTEPGLVEHYARALTELKDPAERLSRLDRARAIWAEDRDVLLSFADALFKQREQELGLSWFELAAACDPDGLNPAWRRACACARVGLWAEARSVLEGLVEREPNAYFVVLLEAAHRKLGSPPSLDRLRRAKPDANPALLWSVTQQRARATGELQLSAALEQRLFALPLDALLDAGWFFVRHELGDEAHALFELVQRHPEHAASAVDTQRLHSALALCLGDAARAAELARALHAGNTELPVFDGEIDAAVKARSAPALHLLASRRLDFILRGATLDWGDGMPERGLIALAQAWRTGEPALEQLQQRYPAHPALSTLHTEHGSST